MGIRVQRNRQKKQNQNKMIQLMVLFIVLGTVTIVGSVRMAINIFEGNTNILAKSQKETENNQYSTMNNVDNVSDNEVDNKNIKTDNKEAKSDDVAYLEKYIGQQVLGQMPEGADGKKVVYLTFDDGPSTTVTPYILNILKREDVKATFFVVGKSVDVNEESKKLLQREYSEGHAIGNHTYSHNYEYLYPDGIINTENFMTDINKTNKAIKNVLGDNFSTRVIRFPGGYMSWNDSENVGQHLNDMGYYYIDWNSLSKDSEGAAKTADELINEVKRSVEGREKAIILMHDNYGKEETAKALPEIITYLRSQGYEFRTIK